MRAQKKQNGYTIVETLIVLAVTGVMFTTTVILVRGQIARYQFRESVLNSQQAIQDALNDVQTGYFGVVNNASLPGCTDGGSTEPGNSNCVYAGKRIQVTTSGNLVATPLVISDSAGSPINAPITNLTLSPNSTTAKLPTGVDYTRAAEVYVLYNNYESTTGTEFFGGAQAVSTYVNDGGTVRISSSSNEQYVCVKNGSRTAKLVLGQQGSSTVVLTYSPSSTECP
jgi:type II secretory pathway pseudopilin PulG